MKFIDKMRRQSRAPYLMALTERMRVIPSGTEPFY